jgi:hypothetical protein
MTHGTVSVRGNLAPYDGEFCLRCYAKFLSVTIPQMSPEKP